MNAHLDQSNTPESLVFIDSQFQFRCSDVGPGDISPRPAVKSELFCSESKWIVNMNDFWFLRPKFIFKALLNGTDTHTFTLSHMSSPVKAYVWSTFKKNLSWTKVLYKKQNNINKSTIPVKYETNKCELK